ncbi:MAG: hypothetical protein GTO40_00400 [Deltaproteobacteria bacterium]|nr:hypothetical protein [Deltaproteobacteria bacterium]
MSSRYPRITAVFILFVATVLISLIAVTNSAIAEGDKSFYKGKRVTFLVQYGPGGTFDVHSRWMARHLTKFTGAKTIVQNIPGGGGVIGYNRLYRTRPDGLTILTAHTKVVAFDLFKRKGVRYKFNEFTYLGRSLPPDTALLVRKDLPTDLNELRKLKTIRMGASSPFYEGLFAEALGLPNVRIVPGFGGLSGRIAGLIRGELDATVGGVSGAIKFADAVKIVAVIAKDKRVPQIPDLKELNGAEPWSNYLRSFSTLMYSTISSPNLDPNRRKFLEEALHSITKDPDALREAKKLKLQIRWDDPTKLRDQTKVFTTLKKKQISELKNVIERKYVGITN